MIRTMSHLKVQMLMREGGQRRGTWDRVHAGQRKMARKPVSSSWLSQPGTKTTTAGHFSKGSPDTRTLAPPLHTDTLDLESLLLGWKER